MWERHVYYIHIFVCVYMYIYMTYKVYTEGRISIWYKTSIYTHMHMMVVIMMMTVL